jgi:hypothetical protein
MTSPEACTCTVNILLGRCQYSCFAAPASSDSLISRPTAVDYSRAVCFLRLVTEACRPMQWTPTRRIHGCYTSHERVPATPPLLETNGGPVSLDESDHIAPCILLHNNQAAHSCSDFALQLSSGQTFEKLALGLGCTASQPPSHPARQQDFRTSIPQRVCTPISRWHTASRTLHFMPKPFRANRTVLLTLSQTIAPPAAPLYATTSTKHLEPCKSWHHYRSCFRSTNVGTNSSMSRLTRVDDDANHPAIPIPTRSIMPSDSIPDKHFYAYYSRATLLVH